MTHALLRRMWYVESAPYYNFHFSVVFFQGVGSFFLAASLLGIKMIESVKDLTFEQV